MSREEAFELISKFDGEYPSDSIPITSDFLGINDKKLIEVIDRHRRQDLWELRDNKWILRFPLTKNEI